MLFKKSDRSAVILALISVLCWSGAATAFKKALFYGTPWLVVFYGAVISTFVFGVVLLTRRAKVTVRDVQSGIYLGFLNPFLYYLVLLNAYNQLPAQIAMVINYLWPVILVLLSIPLLGQKLNKMGFGGILFSFAGVIFLAFMGSNSFEIKMLPLLLAAASTFIWSFYWILNTRNRGKMIAVLFTSFLFGSMYLLIYGFITKQHFLANSAIIPWILYIGVLEMGITYILWNTALKWASSAAVVGGMIFLTPFFALILIGIFVGEKIVLSTVVGLIFVIVGILFEKRSRP